MTTKQEAKEKIAKIKKELDELQRIVDQPERQQITKIREILDNWYGGKIISVTEESYEGRIIVSVKPIVDFEATIQKINNLGLTITGIHSNSDSLNLYFS